MNMDFHTIRSDHSWTKTPLDTLGYPLIPAPPARWESVDFNKTSRRRSTHGHTDTMCKPPLHSHCMASLSVPCGALNPVLHSSSSPYVAPLPASMKKNDQKWWSCHENGSHKRYKSPETLDTTSFPFNTSSPISVGNNQIISNNYVRPYMRRSDSSELSKLRQVPPHLLLSNAQATTRHHCCHQPVAKLHWSLKLPRVSLSLLCFTTTPLSKQIHRPNFLKNKQVLKQKPWDCAGESFLTSSFKSCFNWM